MTSPANSSRKNSRYVEPRERAFALEIVLAQVVVSCALGLAGLALSSHIAIAILTGGMICSLANFWLAIVAFRPALGKSPGTMLAAFYTGEIGKFVITAVLFLIAFKQFALFRQATNALLIFIAYALVQCTVWVYPLARSWLLTPRLHGKNARRD